jgi:hypothetical protein
MSKNHLFKLFALIFIVAFLASCEYEFIEVYTPPPVDLTDTVFFHQEITPIFVNNNCIGCHNGGIEFDLTGANAYNSIISNNLVVPFEPENSKIYTFPNPQTGTHATKYGSNSDANLIRAWIEQGALNN